MADIISPLRFSDKDTKQLSSYYGWRKKTRVSLGKSKLQNGPNARPNVQLLKTRRDKIFNLKNPQTECIHLSPSRPFLGSSPNASSPLRDDLKGLWIHQKRSKSGFLGFMTQTQRAFLSSLIRKKAHTVAVGQSRLSGSRHMLKVLKIHYRIFRFFRCNEFK